MNARGLAEIADRIRLEPGGWSLIVVEGAHVTVTAAELEEELGYLLEDEGVGKVQLLRAEVMATALVDDLSDMAAEDVAIVPLTGDRIASAASALDYARTRLANGPRGVIVTTGVGVQTLAAAAPNLWSWIGPRIWTLDPRAGRIDSEARLASLREGTGLTDEEVIRRAEAGTLDADPVFAEWLVLLGKGELLGR